LHADGISSADLRPVEEKSNGFYTVDSEGCRKFWDLSIDSRVLAYSIGLSILTGLLFGLLPAPQSVQ
jgi:hypothetical protein